VAADGVEVQRQDRADDAGDGEQSVEAEAERQRDLRTAAEQVEASKDEPRDGGSPP